MVPANPPMAAPVPYPGGGEIKPPFEMGVANFDRRRIRDQLRFVGMIDGI